jgi:cytochrome P450
MPTGRTALPPGAAEDFAGEEQLLYWMGRQFAKFGDIFRANIYGSSAYVTRDPRHAQHILRANWQNFVKGQDVKRVALLVGGGLITSEGETWKRQRRMIQPAFTQKSVSGFLDVIITENSALLGQWEQAARRKEFVDVTRDVSDLTLKIILKSIFGPDYPAVDKFNLLSQEGARDLAFARAFGSRQQPVLDVIRRRRSEAAKSNDLLAALIHARDRDTGRAMSDQQVLNEAKTLVVAGHETTASTLNWIWYLLSQSPEAEGRLGEELDQRADGEPDFGRPENFTYARCVIEEALRLYPPLWLVPRKALGDDNLGKFFVPRGTEIYIPIYFIQRHPELWREPDRFDPDRFAPEPKARATMLPFSAGPRNCIGESFARTELLVHLTMVARRLRLRYAQTEPPALDIGVNLRSKAHFLMLPEPRRRTEAP